MTHLRLCALDFLREEREIVVKEARSEYPDRRERDSRGGAGSAVGSECDCHLAAVCGEWRGVGQRGVRHGLSVR